MLHSVTIASGKTQILLPNGHAYDAGETVLLSEAQYARLNQDAVGTLYTYNGPVPDDEVITQAANVAAPAALTATAAAGANPTKAEFDALLDDVTALRTKVAAILTALTGSGKPMASA